MREVRTEFGRFQEEGKQGVLARCHRVEKQAGERVGVAYAPRLGSQRTATPTALRSFCDYGKSEKPWVGFENMVYRLWVKR